VKIILVYFDIHVEIGIKTKKKPAGIVMLLNKLPQGFTLASGGRISIGMMHQCTFQLWRKSTISR
jgi:hypothetical protein